MSKRLGLMLSAVALAAVSASGPHAQTSPPVPQIDADDIGGVVLGPAGPEAGVWVIAETDGQPTRYAKIVITDDQGRFVIPDLPAGAYRVWARGYGIADTARTEAQPGRTVRLNARNATPAEAAAVYPAAYWYAMLDVPPQSAFSGPDRAEGIGETVTSQEQWLSRIKSNGCVGCHQMGNLATRTTPPAFKGMTSEDAFARRVQSGQAGPQMINSLMGTGSLAVRNYAAWTDRIARGELPAARPERPTGTARNTVVTLRDWLTPKHYLHDLIATDRRNPTLYGYGPLYGAPELSTDQMPILDPVANTATVFPVPVRDADTPVAAGGPPGHASPYWGDEATWDSKANIHNPWMDQKGRVWLTAAVRGPDNPAFCRQGSSHPSAKAFPTARAGRHLAVFDPATRDYTFIDTCFSTHHLQFDSQDVLWTSGGGAVIGWLDMKLFDQTGDAERAQGWTALVRDANGNGRRDAFTEPGQPLDPAKDQRLSGGFYAVMPNPADNSVWGSINGFPGALLRLEPGADPSNTALTEIFTPPLPGFGVRGADIDSKGVVWASLASGHLGEFDRRKCRGPLNGPKASGDHCPEGWTLHRLPGPAFAGDPERSVESSYYTWVDQHDTLGLGRDVPIVTGNLFDGLHALVDGRFVTLRTPYPLGFYAKGLEGRIDDPRAGWKGRGLWVTSGDRTPWHMEGGKGTKPLVLHIQTRPSPLAR